MNGLARLLAAVARAWRRQLAAFKRHLEKTP
jgi:hypothetical protein